MSETALAKVDRLTEAIDNEKPGSSTWIALRLLRDEQYHLLSNLGILQTRRLIGNPIVQPVNRGQDFDLPLDLTGVPKCLHTKLRMESHHKRGAPGVDGGGLAEIPVIVGIHTELFRWRRKGWVTRGRDILYFLLHKGTVVYVGRVQDLDDRIVTHAKNKVFDEVWYTGGEYLASWIERNLIRQLRPKYNKIHNPDYK